MKSDARREFVEGFISAALKGHALEAETGNLQQAAARVITRMEAAFDIDPESECTSITGLSIKSVSDNPKGFLNVVYQQKPADDSSEGGCPGDEDPDHGHRHVVAEICFPVPYIDIFSGDLTWFCIDWCFIDPDDL